MYHLRRKATTAASDITSTWFRFHPTDEELVMYHLRRKACGKSFKFQTATEIDFQAGAVVNCGETICDGKRGINRLGFRLLRWCCWCGGGWWC
ncbi:putative transcription factor NAM family [Helianthus anomalus]